MNRNSPRVVKWIAKIANLFFSKIAKIAKIAIFAISQITQFGFRRGIAISQVTQSVFKPTGGTISTLGYESSIFLSGGA